MPERATTGRRNRRLWVLLAIVAVLALAACGNGDDDAADTADNGGDVATTAAPADGADAGDSRIVMDNIQFMPSQIEVPVGTTVEAVNQDEVAHTWTSDDEQWDSGNIAPGDTFSHEFTEAGSFDFHCEIHPSMTGTVTVTG